MAANKLQHYVPKAHLRPFGFGRDNSAIRVFNIASGRYIEAAPIKGQCARDYFYGRDLMLERALQPVEGMYAAIVAKLSSAPETINNKDMQLLRFFALLQTFRTYSYVEKLMAMSDQNYADMVAAGAGSQDIPRMITSMDRAVHMAINHAMRTQSTIDDLDAVVIRNRTKIDIVTSDDPAIQTNRLFLQKRGSEGFGFGSAGAMIYLPLTPRFAFLAFDPYVYHVPGRRHELVDVIDGRDIDALNELQFLHARENIYFSDLSSRDRLTAEFQKCVPRRPATWTRFHFFEKTEENEREENYVPIPLDEMKLVPGREYIVGFHVVRPAPSGWPRLLNHRLRPKLIETGTAAGAVRPGQLRQSAPRRRKIRLNAARPQWAKPET